MILPVAAELQHIHAIIVDLIARRVGRGIYKPQWEHLCPERIGRCYCGCVVRSMIPLSWVFSNAFRHNNGCTLYITGMSAG
jgi:hypothetical protein